MNNKVQPTLGREYALKFLYHLQLTGYKNIKETLEQGGNPDIDLESELDTFHQSFTETDEEHPDNVLTSNTLFFAKNLINQFFNNYQELDNILQKHSSGWKKTNIDKIDKTIILLGICEMKYLKDTPSKVVINEAVNLAKKFGKKESFSFVNGVLDSVLSKEL